MNVEEIGSFRTRTTGDGSLEVWAHGWRLESQLYALIPVGLSLMFLVSPMALAMRGGGAIVMVGAALVVFRMTKPGLLFDHDAVTIVSVVRRQRFGWDAVSGFMGERRHDEGRVLLVLEDERQVPLPGTLDPSELDPYGDEGETLSAVDQLNRLGERSRSGDLPKPIAPPVRLPVAGAESPSRKERRRERKDLRVALKAVQLDRDDTDAPEPAEETAPPRARKRVRRPGDPAPALTQVTIAEPEPEPARSRRQPTDAKPSEPPSYFPTPVYIPQAEYAQMLRDQKAAEKAAAAAAEELSELADLDELAGKDEFSDWTA
ncbi:MAG: hypothetical protein ACRELC_08990 [Gemmatimonadota bacterium]